MSTFRLICNDDLFLIDLFKNDHKSQVWFNLKSTKCVMSLDLSLHCLFYKAQLKLIFNFKIDILKQSTKSQLWTSRIPIDAMPSHRLDCVAHSFVIPLYSLSQITVIWLNYNINCNNSRAKLKALKSRHSSQKTMRDRISTMPDSVTQWELLIVS